jgi:rubrerythrin
MIDWPLTLATVSHALKLVQDMRTLDKEISAAELKLKIADLTTTLADVKLTLTDARAEAIEKDEKIERLESLHRRLADQTVERHGYRYRKDLAGNPTGNPFCPVCFEKAGILIETVDTLMSGLPQQCPSCKALYTNVRTFE